MENDMKKIIALNAIKLLLSSPPNSWMHVSVTAGVYLPFFS